MKLQIHENEIEVKTRFNKKFWRDIFRVITTLFTDSYIKKNFWLALNKKNAAPKIHIGDSIGGRGRKTKHTCVVCNPFL